MMGLDVSKVGWDVIFAFFLTHIKMIPSDGLPHMTITGISFLETTIMKNDGS